MIWLVVRSSGFPHFTEAFDAARSTESHELALSSVVSCDFFVDRFSLLIGPSTSLELPLGHSYLDLRA